MRWVGLVRNVMVGREGLHRDVLLEILAAAGGVDGRSHLATGNLTFSADPGDLADIIERVEAGIASVIGRAEPVIVRSQTAIAELVAQDPFAGVEREGWELLVAFQSQATAPIDAAAIGDVTPSRVVAVTAHELLMVRPHHGRPAPHAGPVLERLTGERATTRAWSTIVRLATYQAM